MSQFLKKFLKLKPEYFVLARHWHLYHYWFQIPVVKLFFTWFAIVPIFLSFTRELQRPIFFQLSEDNSFSLLLELPFNLQILWWGSFSYAIAFFIYSLRCPTFIRLYQDYGAYKQKGHSRRHIVWEAFYAYPARNRRKFLTELVEKGFAEIDESLTEENAPASDAAHTTWVFQLEGKFFALKSSTQGQSTERDQELFLDSIWRVRGEPPILKNSRSGAIVHGPSVCIRSSSAINQSRCEPFLQCIN